MSYRHDDSSVDCKFGTCMMHIPEKWKEPDNRNASPHHNVMDHMSRCKHQGTDPTQMIHSNEKK